jgi:hypothetical protein
VCFTTATNSNTHSNKLVQAPTGPVQLPDKNLMSVSNMICSQIWVSEASELLKVVHPSLIILRTTQHTTTSSKRISKKPTAAAVLAIATAVSA